MVKVDIVELHLKRSRGMVLRIIEMEAMTEQPLTKKTINILDSYMAYHERGAGAPILFLHGNPTSSYLWRDVVPELEGRGRLIALDLIGMGDSGKLPDPGPDTYRFVTHRKYLAAFIDAVIGPSEKILLVIHDWGSALGFDWANDHRDRVRGIAYMEGIVRPVAGWEEWSAAATPIFQGFRSDKGENLILDRNMFVERVLPGSVLRRLTDAEMTEYRKPFLKREDRWPTLTWPRQIPIAGEPTDVVKIAGDYARWMAENEVPKLFVNAEPGAILIGPVREFCRGWKNQREVTVKGSHFIQEDSGAAIGKAIAEWMSAHSL
jgi:haloalkane dehalogenase